MSEQLEQKEQQSEQALVPAPDEGREAVEAGQVNDREEEIEEKEQAVAAMSKAELQALISTAIEERVGILESMLEAQSYNVNDVDAKVTALMEMMPEELGGENDLAKYVQEASRKLCEFTLADLQQQFSDQRTLTAQRFQVVEQESQDKFLVHQQELQKLGGGGRGESLPAAELRAVEEATQQLATQLKEVDYYCKGKILEYARRIDKLDMITEPVKTLVKECSRNTDDISLKVDSKAFHQLSKRLADHYPTTLEFSRLQNTVSMKAEWDDHNDLIQAHYRTKAQLADAQEELEKLKKSYMEFSAAQVQKSEAQKDETEGIAHTVQKVRQVLKKSMAENQTELAAKTAEMDAMVANFTDQLSTLGTKEEMAKLQATIDDCVTYEHMQELRDLVLPTVSEVRIGQNKVLADNEDMRRCIAAFDEVLLTKANKSGLITLEQEIDVAFVKHYDWKTIKDTLQKHDDQRNAQVEEIQQTNQDHRDNLTNSVQAIVDKIASQKFKDYERVAKTFQQFFSMEELDKVLAKKADIELIDALAKSKASSAQLQHCESLIEALNVRLKHLGILQCEIAKAAVPSQSSSSCKGGESLNTQIQRRDFLSKQAQIMSQWISDMPLNKTAVGVTSGEGQNMQLLDLQSMADSTSAALSKQNEPVYAHYVPQNVLEFEKHRELATIMPGQPAEERPRPGTTPTGEQAPTQMFSRRNKKSQHQTLTQILSIKDRYQPEHSILQKKRSSMSNASQALKRADQARGADKKNNNTSPSAAGYHSVRKETNFTQQTFDHSMFTTDAPECSFSSPFQKHNKDSIITQTSIRDRRMSYNILNSQQTGQYGLAGPGSNSISPNGQVSKSGRPAQGGVGGQIAISTNRSRIRSVHNHHKKSHDRALNAKVYQKQAVANQAMADGEMTLGQYFRGPGSPAFQSAAPWQPAPVSSELDAGHSQLPGTPAAKSNMNQNMLEIPTHLGEASINPRQEEVQIINGRKPDHGGAAAQTFTLLTSNVEHVPEGGERGDRSLTLPLQALNLHQAGIDGHNDKQPPHKTSLVEDISPGATSLGGGQYYLSPKNPEGPPVPNSYSTSTRKGNECTTEPTSPSHLYGPGGGTGHSSFAQASKRR